MQWKAWSDESHHVDGRVCVRAILEQRWYQDALWEEVGRGIVMQFFARKPLVLSFNLHERLNSFLSKEATVCWHTWHGQTLDAVLNKHFASGCKNVTLINLGWHNHYYSHCSTFGMFLKRFHLWELNMLLSIFSD